MYKQRIDIYEKFWFIVPAYTEIEAQKKVVDIFHRLATELRKEDITLIRQVVGVNDYPCEEKLTEVCIFCDKYNICSLAID